MTSIYRWFFPTEEQKAEQKKQKEQVLRERIQELLPKGTAGYKLDVELGELKKTYIKALHEQYYKYDLVSFTTIEQQKKESEILQNSTKYYNLWWPKKIIFRVRQIAALHTISPNKISMLCVITLAILCYILASIPSIFGYAIYPIMLFLTAPLLRHVSLMKWHTLFNNEKTRKIEILAPILFGISLTITGVIAKLVGAISIPFIATNLVIIAAACVVASSISYMLYTAWQEQFDLLFFMTAATILGLALIILAPIVVESYITLITNITLLLGAASLCIGFYNLYTEDSAKFWTLLCGLAIITATITLAAALLNASCLFLLSPHLTFEMIASSLTVGMLASIILYGCATPLVKQNLYVAANELPSNKCFDINFNLDHLSFWNIGKPISTFVGRAATKLASTCSEMIMSTFSSENISIVVTSAATTCSAAFTGCYKKASSCFNQASTQQPGSRKDSDGVRPQ
jgi:hypothetical protein